LGSEGEGLPEELVRDCEGAVGIPMEGRVESLNAGIAGSLALFQAGAPGAVP
jgi:TrmH family RNA methyltransferase